MKKIDVIKTRLSMVWHALTERNVYTFWQRPTDETRDEPWDVWTSGLFLDMDTYCVNERADVGAQKLDANFPKEEEGAK